ncbi:hypothetical protein SAMN05421819_0432 [Bryocella elongata]|uniref:Uncharacterized protein n=1 Tax=Bryocella elongata TaxID=863522 RepID=A0A1H5T0Y7_9BACT|nr:hypothetical protein SAMN05421819_0432 [Bryocella elongata]
MRDYLYIDRNRIDSLVDQLALPKNATSKRSKKWSLSLSGPKVELGEEDNARSLNDHEKVEFLLGALLRKGLLFGTRPIEQPAPRGFILEETTARKVILPTKDVKSALGAEGMAVWVSDPDPTVYTSERWDWKGSFLYLTEIWLDDRAQTSMYSGRSALQALTNLWRGEDVLSPWLGEEWEPLGRGSYAHPTDKLRSLGATVGDERSITTLYMPRYMSDEQCYRFDGQERRVHDLLGYPVFITRNLA